MSNIISLPLRRSPQYSQRVDTARFPGLTGVWLFSGAGISPNLVTGEAPTNAGVGVTDAAMGSFDVGSVIGRDLNLLTASQQIIVGRTEDLFGSDTCSVLFVARRNGSTGERGVWCCIDASSGGVGIVPDSATGANHVWQVQARAGGPSDTSDGGILHNWTFETEPDVYLCTALAGENWCYQSGVQTANGTVSDTNVPSGNWGISGNGDWDSFIDTDSSFYLVATLNRALSAAEAYVLRNPWLLFKPQYMYFVPTAVAGDFDTFAKRLCMMNFGE